MKLIINNKLIKHVRSVKYLGVMLDCHLNWKDHISSICKKLSRGTGVLCKVRHFVTTKILIQLYYSITYPFLIFGCTVWGMIYNTNIQPIVLLQKKIIRIMTFSKFDAHTNPIFHKLKLLKINEIIKLYIAIFMYQYVQGMLPNAFDSFFTTTNSMHDYSTRLALKSTFHLPKIRTNFGKFSIRYFGSKVWNGIEDSLKSLTFFRFKRQLKESYLKLYETT